MRPGIRAIDAVLVAWTLAWLVAAAVTYSSLKELEDGGELPFVSGNPGEAVEQTATDLDGFAVRVRQTGRDARVTGAQARDSAATLAIVLGLAVALTPTRPILFLYLLLRPLVAQ